MKRLMLVLLVVSLLLAVAACGAESTGPRQTITVPSGMVPPGTTVITIPPPAPEQARGFLGGIFGDEDVPPPVIVYQTPAPTTMPIPRTTTTQAAYSSAIIPAERMIIRTADLQLVVTDVAAAIGEITGLAGTYGGFVVSSNSWQDRDRMMGNITFRVNAENFAAAIAALHALAVDVRAESTSGQDVTEEYVDLTARLTNLEAAEAQLLELMAQSGNVSEILEVQRELVKTRGEIEQTRGRLQYLEQSSAMSYISVTLEQSKLAVEFNASTRNAREGEKIYFNPIVSGGFEPYSYEWDFGDGGTSTEYSPDHAYRSDGAYSVSLKVTDDRGNTESFELKDYITVRPGWDAGGIAGGAWNGLVAFFRVLANILIWLGIFSPVWIIVLVILYFAWWRRRKKA
jgi:hypothetical protein